VVAALFVPAGSNNASIAGATSCIGSAPCDSVSSFRYKLKESVMRRTVLVAATLSLSMLSPVPSCAQEARNTEANPPGPDERAREVTGLKREVDRLKTEVTALKKQVEELKKTELDMSSHVEMLLKHRHQLFLDSMRADAFFPQAKGTFFVTTPSPENLTKTSGPISDSR
jgi:hypothetical protein